MTTYKFGDIILVKFPFTSGSAFKKRPAFVLCDSADGDLIVMRITSQEVKSESDIKIVEWHQSGLLAESFLRVYKIATIESNLVERKIGETTANDLLRIKIRIKEKLKSILI